MNKQKVYVIAEAGVNHNGQRDLAFSLIDAAAAAGADAVKFQTFSAELLASRFAPKASYQKASTSESESQLEMLRKLELPQQWHVELQAHARAQGIEFLSTAFDSASLEFLIGLDMAMFKIPSGEITNGPLLWRFARTFKPLIVSTGMATLSEVEQALAIIAHARLNEEEPAHLDEIWKCWARSEARESLQGWVTLLHCTSQYPTPMHEVNLRAMDTLASTFSLPVGYSDHTAGGLISTAAVARGACVIEKHFTLDRKLPGPDHAASLEPEELKRLVLDIRELEVALGDSFKAPQPSEWDTRLAARQQIIASKSIRKGSVIESDQLTTARCGSGLMPTHIWSLVGQVAQRDYAVGEVIQ
ncbi:N-acetylneuraminate synthase [Pseudomonas sp. H9]|uniref:N-acetylneuraminate synthase n=1 Tax=Pseudomonas sp. H9 TaxID=483968 RepID=UPI001057B9B3|nr:N-acetylneuraminate synthase [Pseudomonas sp. H9]TDF81190.1 N-acetylneuraminate synthase [Pseudomonas sp. H9]